MNFEENLAFGITLVFSSIVFIVGFFIILCLIVLFSIIGVISVVVWGIVKILSIIFSCIFGYRS